MPQSTKLSSKQTHPGKDTQTQPCSGLCGFPICRYWQDDVVVAGRYLLLLAAEAVAERLDRDEQGLLFKCVPPPREVKNRNHLGSSF